MIAITNHHLLPRRISFSSYWSMKTCIGFGLPVSFFVSNDDLSQLGATNKSSVLGIFFHELVKSVGESLKHYGSHGVALQNEFQKTVDSFKKRFRAVDLDYEPIIQDIYNTILFHLRLWEENGKGLIFEKEIVSRDGTLIGRPDIINISSNKIEIIDLKLAKKIEKLRTQRNISQLDFYAHLAQEDYQIIPETGVLIGLNGLEFRFELDRERTREIVEDAQRVLHRLERVSRSCMQLEELATPEYDTCCQCRLKTHCKNSATGD